MRRGYFSKTARRDYAEKMDAIRDFCDRNDISHSIGLDSFYFTVGGVRYRVSNHTIAASNRGAFNEDGEQIRELYHSPEEEEETVCITAGKTRLIEVFNNILAGEKIDKRGRVVDSVE